MNNINLLFNYVQKCIEDGPFIAKSNICFEDITLKNRNQFKDIKNCVNSFLMGNTVNRFVYMPGLRGVGKTTLLFQLYDYLINKGVNKERMLYFSADTLKQLLNNDICDVVEVFVNDYYGIFEDINEKIFIFVDEVQEFPDFIKQAQFINSLSENIFLFFAGSGNVKSFDNPDKYAKIENIDPLRYNEYLSINYGVNFNERLSLNLMKTIFTGNLLKTSDLEKKFYNVFDSPDLFMKKSFEHYLLCGSFPESMNLNVYWGHKQIYNNLVNIIEKDLFFNGSYTPQTKDKVFKVLSFIAFQKSGNFTQANLAKLVKISYSHLFGILDSLENLNLIFHIDPCENKKGVKRARNYYFTSPNFHAAINSQVGNFIPKNMEYLEVLAKSYVASTLVKMKNIYRKPFDIFIPQGNNQADFILISKNKRFIPIEVSFGRKLDMNIHNTFEKYGCDHGVVISDEISTIEKVYDLIHIPINTFSLF